MISHYKDTQFEILKLQTYSSTTFKDTRFSHALEADSINLKLTIFCVKFRSMN